MIYDMYVVYHSCYIVISSTDRDLNEGDDDGSVTCVGTTASTAASTTAAKQGGGVVNLLPPGSSRKPKDGLLHSCIEVTNLPDGKLLITCCKCPKDVAKPVKQWRVKTLNAKHIRDHLLCCAGVDISLAIKLQECKLSCILYSYAYVMLYT